MNTYTVFCRDLDDPRSTTWISKVEAVDDDLAREDGRLQCADDWGYQPGDVDVIGVLEGDVAVLQWDDYGL